MHISLLTATGAYNLGDELILAQEHEYLNARYPGAIFHVFTYDPESSLLPKDKKIRDISYFPNNLRKHPFANIAFFFENLITLATSDLIVIGGGGLIYDNESGQSFSKLLTEWKIRIFIARLFHIPVLYWSLGIHVKPENQIKIRPLFEGENTSISVRDTASKRTLDTLGIRSVLMSDPVFLYDPEMPKLLPKKRPKIGLALRSGYLPHEQETIERMITFLQKEEYEVVLLNHSFHATDRGSNDSDFLSLLREKYQLSSTQTMQETLEAYKDLEFMIGMRLHSLILALVHAIPFFAISYSQKTDEFIRSLSYDYSLGAHTFDIEHFKK